MKKNLIFRLLSSLILAPIIIFIIYKGDIYFLCFLVILSILGIYEILKLKIYYIKFIILILFISFIYFLYKIINLENGQFFLFLIILITWLSDIGGYVFGKFLKGPKINIISPNKTYAGFLGSLIFVQIAIIFLNRISLNIFTSDYNKIIFLFISSLFVIIGDLCFSYFKRVCKVKDFSNLIPGHGGIFDRIDGMVFLTIFFYFYLNL